MARLVFTAVVLAVLGVSGCAIVAPEIAPGGRAVRPGDPGGPFAASSMRVDGLTGFGELGGRPVLTVHLELLDRWGHVVKSSGRLELSLVPARGGAEPTVYDVDLNDLRLNARLYDPVTRTYRVTLERLPGFASAAARGDGTLMVLATLTLPGADGEDDLIRARGEVR